MFGSRNAEVLIVGAGPAGLSAALFLARHEVPVEIIDEEFRPAAHSYALALHPRSLELLEPTGVMSGLLAHGRRIEKIVIHGPAGKQVQLDLTRLACRYPFVLVTPQNELEAVLEQALHDHHVTVHWNHRIARMAAVERHGASGLMSTIERLEKVSAGDADSSSQRMIEHTSTLDTAFVVGADGHESFVRRHLQIPFAQLADSQTYAVFELQIDRDPGDVLHVVIDAHTTSSLWPLPGRCCRWSFQLTDPGIMVDPRRKDRLAVPPAGRLDPQLSPDCFRRLLAERAPWFEAKVLKTDWAVALSFERRLADHYGRDRTWLVGDAAHITGPLGVHSANLGIREAGDLADRLTGILRGTTALDCLQEYHTSYHHEWRDLLQAEAGVKTEDGAHQWLREQGGRLLGCLPVTGPELTDLARQIGLHYPNP